jgi:hypothetical protein
LSISSSSETATLLELVPFRKPVLLTRNSKRARVDGVSQAAIQPVDTAHQSRSSGINIGGGCKQDSRNMLQNQSSQTFTAMVNGQAALNYLGTINDQLSLTIATRYKSKQGNTYMIANYHLS